MTDRPYPEDDLCPECGLQFSSSIPSETFDGFEEDVELRACLDPDENRVYIHSTGDVRGYPVDAPTA